MQNILKDRKQLLQRLQQTAGEKILAGVAYPLTPAELAAASAVLFLLGYSSAGNGAGPEPCLILNKRSKKVNRNLL